MPAGKSFKATLERGAGALEWVIIRVPFDIGKVWGVRGQLRVKGEINGFAFRTSLFPDGDGGHYMCVNKTMQNGARVAPGASAAFRLEPDLDERVVRTPRELEQTLREDKDLAAYVKSLSPSTRKEIAAFVASAKHPETRLRRANQLAERLYQTMEAERGDLPPVLKSALASTPKARAAWEMLPPSHRRQHLLGIFYYRDPESRARRVNKAIDMMIEYAERRSSRKS
jgi:uncharacterized protein YdeI (YjbR/CyaY-like superfamily)